MQNRRSTFAVALLSTALAMGCEKSGSPPTSPPAAAAAEPATTGPESLLQPIQGAWVGTYTLTWMDPAKSAFTEEASAGTATVNGDVVEYTWEFRGTAQRGTIEWSQVDAGVQSRFVDTWHTPDNQALVSTGALDNGLLDVLGSYPAGDGPDWGWRTELEVGNADAFVLRMYNITPDGQEGIAVELACKRAP